MTSEMSKHDHILAGLVFSLQAAAMQQLGKIQNPLTGEMEKDLEQAKGTIDLLDMLKNKCRTDTPEDLLRMIDSAVMDLQLNYADEMKRSAKAQDSGDDGAPGAAGDATEGEGDAAADQDETPDDGAGA